MGRAYWVQTPNRWFPVEQHLLTPFLHWLPKPWQRAIAPRFNVWQMLTRPSADRREFLCRALFARRTPAELPRNTGAISSGASVVRTVLRRDEIAGGYEARNRSGLAGQLRSVTVGTFIPTGIGLVWFVRFGAR